MLTSLRSSSRTLRHVLTFIKHFHPEIGVINFFKLQRDPQLKLYHSITQSQEVLTFSIPREEYPLKQDVVAKENWMITKLCREGKISEARKLFDVMPDRDVISWTALISGYVKCGLVKEARELFDRADAKKDVVTWTSMISGYLKSKRISEAERLFHAMPDKNVVTWNTMIDGYVRSGRIEHALTVFDEMGERNVVSWNTVISGLVNCGRIDEAMGFFSRTPLKNVISWTIMISGLARNKRVDEARLLFDTVPERNVVSWNAMITGYAQNTRLSEAYNLFKKMPEKDAQSWNAMITAFIQNGELEKARKLFDEMPAGKNVVSWTAIISGLMQSGESEEALRLFYVMNKSSKVKPNEATFASVLGACSDLAGLGEGMQVHQVISKTAYQESKFVISALINMYSKCGEIEMARQMFDYNGFKDLVCFNSIISAYAHHGFGREAISVFEEMQKTGFKPNEVTYVALLSACSHAGLVQEGLNYFKALLKNESLKVRDDHYTCVVDLYGRAGKLKEAFDLLQRAPLKESAYSWGPLLSGCNIHGNLDMGKVVAEKLLELDSVSGGIYVLLFNMYSNGGKLKEAEKMKMKMKEGRLKKEPGCSWIEVGNKFHVFVVGDRCNGESEGVCFLLFDLHEKMKKVGSLLDDVVVMEECFL
ncbi:hypothetical protein ABFS82_10G156000 [Erythranthe guttata]|nr:PREDICTED: pentatricopeptide repeat-containing protein At2g35030, mitochondrial [Erythranthe guttata]|eukprot:XP_012828198.1 PREDICTED: pentatricopeptide repeat-containing protein At2g35030, mitochondrial [Erythranthe guttata]